MLDLEEQLRAYGPVLDRAEAAVGDVVAMLASRRRAGLLVLAAAFVAIVVAVVAVVVARDDATRPRVVTPPTPTTVADPAKGPAPTPILAIGDSVMLSARDEIFAAVPGIVIDAAVGYQFADLPGVVRGADVDPRTIVVAVGANGRITQDAIDALVTAAGDRRLVLINNKVPRAWEAENNALLYAAVQRTDADITLVDWNKIARGHDDWFAAGGFHTKGEGRYAYASAIAGALGRPAALELTVEEQYPHNAFEGKVLLAEAAGDVWIAAEHKLERRKPDGTLVATIELPFQYGVENIASSKSAVWVNGMVSDAGPEFGLVRVDASTNKIGLDLRSPSSDAACACMIAASDDLLAVNRNGSLQGVDAHTGAVVSNTFDMHVTALAVIDDTIYTGSDAAVGVQRADRRPPFHLIELQKGDGDVRALTPTANGDLLIATASGRVYRGGRAARFEGLAWNVAAIDEGDRTWVAGARMVTMVADGVSIGFVYDDDSRTFDHGTSLEQPVGFTGVVAIGDRLWLARTNEVLRVRVG